MLVSMTCGESNGVMDLKGRPVVMEALFAGDAPSESHALQKSWSNAGAREDWLGANITHARTTIT